MNLLVNSRTNPQANAGSSATRNHDDDGTKSLLHSCLDVPTRETVSTVSSTQAKECLAQADCAVDFCSVVQQLLLPVSLKNAEDDWCNEASHGATLQDNIKGSDYDKNDSEEVLLNRNAIRDDFKANSKGCHAREGDAQGQDSRKNAQGGYLMDIYHDECSDLSIYLPYVSYTPDVSKIKEMRIGDLLCIKMEESHAWICSCPFCFIASKKQNRSDFKQTGWHRGKIFDPQTGGLGVWHQEQIKEYMRSSKNDWDQKTAHMCWFLHTERVCLEQVMRHLKHGYHHDDNFTNNLLDIIHSCVCEVGRRLNSIGTDGSQWFDGPESDILREYVCTVFTSLDDGSNLVYEMELDTAYTHLCNQECDRIQVLLREYVEDPRTNLGLKKGLADVEILLVEVNKVRAKLRECLLELQASDDEDYEVMFK
jgi:hypothetical protein